MGSRHCLKVWTQQQQVVCLSSAEGELYAAVRAASEGLGMQSAAIDLGVECRLTLHLDASATMGLVNRTGLGEAKHVDMQYPVDTGGIQVWEVRHEESRLKREARRLDD